MVICFYLQSHNWNGVHMTAFALKAARLEMGTSDWHTHKATMVTAEKAPKGLVDYDWALDRWFDVATGEVLWEGAKEESSWDVI